MSDGQPAGDRSATGRVTLIVSHAKDADATKTQSYLAGLAQRGLTRTTYWFTVDSARSTISSDFRVKSLLREGVVEVNLFEVLSGLGGVAAVDIAAIVAGDLDAEALEALRVTVPSIRDAFVRWLRQAQVHDLRVSARQFGALLPDSKFFSPAASARVVLLPLDPSHDYSVFRPINGDVSASAAGHSAVELASLLGCWEVQREIPADQICGSSQGGEGGIAMVLSSVRVLAVPAPPLSEALGNSTNLPVPVGFTAVPRPERLAGGLADKIYPEELVFEATPRPEGPSEFTSIDKFLRRFIRQFLVSVGKLPRVIKVGLQREMDDLAVEVVQDAIGGAAASVGVVNPDTKRRGTGPVDFDALIELLITKASSDIDQNYRFGIPAQQWQAMSRTVLTLADGQGAPSERLLSDDTVISSVDVLAPPCGESDEGWQVVQALVDIPAESEDRSVIENVARRFRREIQSANHAVAAALSQLRGLPSIIRSRPEIKGDEIIRIAAVIGAALILISVGSFSPLRPAFAFEWLPFPVRDAAWAFPTFLGGLVSVWALLHMAMKSDKARRIVDVVSSLLIPMILLTVLVQFADIRIWAIRNGGGSNYRYAVALFVLYVVVAVLAIVRAFRSPNERYRAFGRAGVLVGSVYLVVAAIVGLAQDELPLIEGLPEVRTPVFIVLFPSALISFSISVSRIAMARVREIYKALLVGRLIEWGIGEFRKGRDAEIRLEVLRVHWAALGAVLTRLIRFPLGRDLAATPEQGNVLSGQDDPLKIDFARLALTERGRSGLESRLRQSVVKQGWLNNQSAVLLDSYSKVAAFDRGLTEDESVKIDPLSCTATPTAEEAGSGAARGDRWSLVSQLYGGVFEDVLRLPAEDIRFDTLYESVLLDNRSVVIDGAAHPSPDASRFLSQAISNGSLTVPVGFLNILYTGQDKRLNMQRMAWWPSSFIGQPTESRPDEAELRESALEKPWAEFGTRLALSVQVSWTEQFKYDDYKNANHVTTSKTPAD